MPVKPTYISFNFSAVFTVNTTCRSSADNLPHSLRLLLNPRRPLKQSIPFNLFRFSNLQQTFEQRESCLFLDTCFYKRLFSDRHKDYRNQQSWTIWTKYEIRQYRCFFLHSLHPRYPEEGRWVTFKNFAAFNQTFLTSELQNTHLSKKLLILVKLRTSWEMNKRIFLFKMEQPHYTADYGIHLDIDIPKLTQSAYFIYSQ